MAFSRLPYLISRNRFQRKLKSLYRGSKRARETEKEWERESYSWPLSVLGLLG